MGSSGGHGFYGYTGMWSKMKSRISENDAQSSQREIEINKFLEDMLKEFNNRDVEAIRTHLNEIEKTLGREIDGLESILFGGSISKNTFVEGMSDVDALVFLDSKIYKNESPKKLQDVFYEMLKTRFPRTEINKGELAVTLKFSDYEIQLLPAIRENEKIRIANKNREEWTKLIDVSNFKTKLTDINKNNNNKVVPVIKLAKNIFNKLPNEYQLSGYHTEALAVEAFANYKGRYTLYDMTKHFLDYTTKRILTPMNDVTGQSNIIDDYFGNVGSASREKISNYIKNISKRFSELDINSLKEELF